MDVNLVDTVADFTVYKLSPLRIPEFDKAEFHHWTEP
jgi:hypothetical protein